MDNPNESFEVSINEDGVYVVNGPKLNNCADDPREIAQMVAERTRSQVVQVIGKKIVLYKESKDNKKIILP